MPNPTNETTHKQRIDAELTYCFAELLAEFGFPHDGTVEQAVEYLQRAGITPETAQANAPAAVEDLQRRARRTPEPDPMVPVFRAAVLGLILLLAILFAMALGGWAEAAWTEANAARIERELGQ